MFPETKCVVLENYTGYGVPEKIPSAEFELYLAAEIVDIATKLRSERNI